MTTNLNSKLNLKQKEEIVLSGPEPEFLDIKVPAPKEGIKYNEEILEKISYPTKSDDTDDIECIDDFDDIIEKIKDYLKKKFNEHNFNASIKEIKEINNKNNFQEKHQNNILNLTKKIKNLRDKNDKYVGYKIILLAKEEIFEDEIKRYDYAIIIHLIINDNLYCYISILENWNSCFDEIDEELKKNDLSYQISEYSSSYISKKIKKKVWCDKLSIIKIKIKYPEEIDDYNIDNLKKMNNEQIGFYLEDLILNNNIEKALNENDKKAIEIIEQLNRREFDLNVLDKCKYKKIIIPKYPYILENLNNLFKSIVEFENIFFYNFDFKKITKDNSEFILLRSHDYYYIYEFEYLSESRFIKYIMKSLNGINALMEKNYFILLIFDNI